MHDLAQLQAALGTQYGGLGLRKASNLKLPAFIASKLAVFLVFRLAESLNEPGMLPSTFEIDFTFSLDRAVDEFKSTINSEHGNIIDDMLIEVSNFSEKVARVIYAGKDLPSRTENVAADPSSSLNFSNWVRRPGVCRW